MMKLSATSHKGFLVSLSNTLDRIHGKLESSMHSFSESVPKSFCCCRNLFLIKSFMIMNKSFYRLNYQNHDFLSRRRRFGNDLTLLSYFFLFFSCLLKRKWKNESENLNRRFWWSGRLLFHFTECWSESIAAEQHNCVVGWGVFYHMVYQCDETRRPAARFALSGLHIVNIIEMNDVEQTSITTTATTAAIRIGRLLRLRTVNQLFIWS